MTDTRTMRTLLFFLLVLAGGFNTHCQKSMSVDDPPLIEPADSTQIADTLAPPVTPITPCDTIRPLVLVHGFLASGDTWASFGQRFHANGYCLNRIWTFDWNSINQFQNHADALDAFIDTVRSRTGAPQVDLAGHSAGGGLGYTYLSNPARAAKVAHYVHIGSNPQTGPAGPGGSVPTLNLWSDGDEIVAGNDIPGAANLMLSGLDHYQVATSNASFAAVHQFLTGQPANVLEPGPENPVCIGGKALTFGENTPAAGAGLAIYYLDPATGQRSGPPIAELTVDAQGFWPALNVAPHVPMEFVVTPAGNGRPVHYFREGFNHTNSWVYLRTLPPPGSIAGLLLAGLPNTASQAVVNIFSSSQAVIYQRDSLELDGIQLATSQYAPASKTAISYFLYDGNQNQQSDLTPVGLFGNFPFLNGVDVFINPDNPAPLIVKLNDRVQTVRRIPSSTGITVIVFD